VQDVAEGRHGGHVQLAAQRDHPDPRLGHLRLDAKVGSEQFRILGIGHRDVPYRNRGGAVNLGRPYATAMQAAWAYARRFYRKAYEDNVTGLAGMVAYNMLLSVLPLALIALFVGGQVLQSTHFQDSV